MAEKIVRLLRCPECGLAAKLSATELQITDVEAKCNHRQDPLNCPSLRPALCNHRQDPLNCPSLRPALTEARQAIQRLQ
jgi:hypothetical protein